MNYWAAWGPTAVAIIVAIFTYGRLTQRQDDHGERLDGHDARLDKHGEHLQRVDVALVKVEEYQRGLADGIRASGKFEGK